MLVLDTNHLRVLQKQGPQTPQLVARLKASQQEVVTTVVNVQETIEGWLKEITRYNRTPRRQVPFYEELRKLILFYAGLDQVLPFDAQAVAQFEALAPLRLKIGPQDLRIAAIVLGHDALLLSANLKDFRLVPGLQVADWLHESDVQ